MKRLISKAILLISPKQGLSSHNDFVLWEYLPFWSRLCVELFIFLHQNLQTS
uniref:Uncharacterized protein n=1 Tax=Helianthus annuus TaxID=4232 RepID=A0A251TMJ5_HELAN